MSEEEFSRTGLDKLTPVQRANLNRWLAARARFKLEETSDPKKGEKAQKSAKSDTKPPKRVVAKRLSLIERTKVKPIRTRIVGPFRGWTGSTVFALENGQYWKKRQSGNYRYKAESPEVELFKNRLGFWEIKILATGKTVKVSRYDP